MRYTIDTSYDPEKQLHAFQVIPEVVGRIGPFQSPVAYPSATEALIAGVRYLEGNGVTNINWQAVGTLLVG
ncbi:hypothetical protein C5O80_30450 [Burkholderia sp. SRS-46]|nr:hypothetical protein C5O80_30450 [Burkholderia sp. SRS-46]